MPTTVIAILLLVLLSAPGAGAQQEDALAPKGPAPAYTLDASMASFLITFNAGELAPLEEFVAEWFAPDLLAQYSGADTVQDRIRGASVRFHDLHRLYGDVSAWRLDDSFEPAIVWTHASAVGGWIGFQRQQNAATKAWERLVVWRIRPPGTPPRAPAPIHAVQDSLEAYFSANAAADRFSGVVLVGRGDSLIFHRAYGTANQETGESIGLDHRFNVGSVSKMFTGVAALQLVEDGALALNDALSKYVPEYPRTIGDEVTIRDLLIHTSGIELDDKDGFGEAIREATTMDEILSVHLRFLGPAASYEPTGEFDYTNEGISLVGVVVERVARRPWVEVLQQRVFGPAGMMTTTPRPPENAPVAIGYTALDADGEYAPGARRAAWPLIKRHAQPAGQHWTTAEDLWRFWRALLQGRLLGRTLVEQMMSPQIESGALASFDLRSAYGYAVQIESRGGRSHVGHAGVVPGYSAAVRHYPDSDWTVIVVANLGDTAAHVAAEHVEELILGSGEPLP